MRSLPRLAAAAAVAGWLAMVCGGMIASPTRAALPVPSGLVPALPLPTMAPAPSPTSTAAPKPTPRPTLPLPVLPLPTLAPLPTVAIPTLTIPTLAPIPTLALPTLPLPTPTAAPTEPSKTPGPSPSDTLGASAAPPTEPSPSRAQGVSSQASGGPIQGGGPPDAMATQPDGGHDTDGQSTPDALRGLLVPAATIAVSGALILFLVLVQVMGGIAFVPVVRRVIRPSAASRRRSPIDDQPEA